MLFVTRLLEPWTDDKPALYTRKKYKSIHYKVVCKTCGHQCTLTFINPTVSLYAEDERCAGALSLLCTKLAKEDKDDLVGKLRAILAVRGE